MTNILKGCFFTKLSRNLIASQLVTALAKNPTINAGLIWEGVKFLNSNKTAPNIIGVESRKDIFADLFRVNPSINATVIVIPERETPGTIAIA